MGEDTSNAPLAPKKLTERFATLEAGDRLRVNGHETIYEVIDTDDYSVIAENQHGHRVTFAQNLQTGGWSLNEEIFHVTTDVE